MLDDARPPVDVKQRCNPTALNLLSDHHTQLVAVTLSL